MTDLLLRARELLPYPDQSAQVVHLLERAYQLDPEHREIWSLVDRVIASNAAVRAAANAEQSSLLLPAVLNEDARWQELRAVGMALIEQVEDLEASLAAAYAIARLHQDFARALRLLQRFWLRTFRLPRHDSSWKHALACWTRSVDSSARVDRGRLRTNDG